jgi:twinkle protein
MDDADKGRGGLGDVVLQTKAPCPDCGKERVSIYADGHEHCFASCGYHKPPAPEFRERKESLTLTRSGWVEQQNLGPALPALKLEAKTTRRYGYFTGPYKGRNVQVAPLFDQTGNLIGQELRHPGDKFEVLGTVERAQLWGMHVWGDGRDRKVVVHATKRSAMSTAQVTAFKVPSVAPPLDGEGQAAKSCKENYRWLDRFQEIILFFPDTEPGNRAAQEIAGLFQVGKVKIARVEGAADASDALKQGRPGDIDQALWNAVTWRPRGIVNANEGRDQLFEEGLQTPSWPYPWAEFNDKTMGIRPGEVTYHIGGTGIAKTTLLFHYAVHLLQDEGKPFLVDFPRQPITKVGWLGFEDLTKQVKVGMLGIYAGRMLSLEALPKEEALRLHDELFGSKRLELYDPENAEYQWEAIKGYIRYLVKALDCHVIFMDPMTVVTAQFPVANRTQEEERMAAWLAAEAKALKAAFHVSYHLKKPDGTPFEEGRKIGLNDIKGSGALSHFSHNVLAYRRDQQGPRPDLLEVSSLKNRVARYTGVVTCLQYDMKTGRYSPTAEAFPEEGAEEGSKKGFKPLEPGKDY